MQSDDHTNADAATAPLPASVKPSGRRVDKVFHTIPLLVSLGSDTADGRGGAPSWPCDLRMLCAGDASASVFAIGLEDGRLDRHVYCTSMNVTVKQPIFAAVQPAPAAGGAGDAADPPSDAAGASVLAIYHPRPFALLRRQQNSAIGQFLLALSSMALGRTASCSSSSGGGPGGEEGGERGRAEKEGARRVRAMMIVDDGGGALFRRTSVGGAAGAGGRGGGDGADGGDADEDDDDDAETRAEEEAIGRAAVGYDGDWSGQEEEEGDSDHEDDAIKLCLHFRLETSVLTDAALSAGVIRGNEEIDDVCMRMECARVARPPHVASLALMMAAHGRLGRDSAIGRLLGPDLLQLVCDMYRRRLYECRRGVWP